MPDFKCPGSAIVRQPIPELFTCQSCGTEVEIWTNERMRKCSSCGKSVVRELDNAWCIQWCQYAKECIGVERYEGLLKAGALSKAWEGEVCIPERLKEFMKESGVPIPGDDADAQSEESRLTA